MRGPTSPDVYTLRNGGDLGMSCPWLWAGEVLKGQTRLGLASSLLPPLLPDPNNSPVSASPTGLLDRILVEDQMLKLRKLLTTSGLIPPSSDTVKLRDQTADVWHGQAFCVRCPLGQQWQVLTYRWANMKRKPPWTQTDFWKKHRAF